ncbi:hypothetical protein PFBG_00015 [Plasmodium falciparum 7G8]|uniref:Plasmodium RESA N-terminal domain-containing protein n=1 Tax=Plasmodium falciparum (isolate 7G8) TaxID=57266 RepID=W7F8Q6_PLAF8|nr:hypothetical protein PFBG_00015 [Plasmodium falciparum 7G8]
MDGRVYHIYKRNLFMLESVEHSKFRKGSISENDVNFSDMTTEGECNHINYIMIYQKKEHPSNKNFYSIWKNVLCITKEEFDDISKELSFYIEDYLPKYEYPCYNHFRCKDRPVCAGTKYRTFTLSSIDVKDTLNFYNLVKDGVSIDEMKYYVYYFIKYDDSLKIDLYNKHKYIFTERVKYTQRLYILTKFKCM